MASRKFLAFSDITTNLLVCKVSSLDPRELVIIVFNSSAICNWFESSILSVSNINLSLYFSVFIGVPALITEIWLSSLNECKYSNHLKNIFSASSSLALANDTSVYSIQIEYSSSFILNIFVF